MVEAPGNNVNVVPLEIYLSDTSTVTKPFKVIALLTVAS